jgi:Ni/Co efflux regulator RcnB
MNRKTFVTAIVAMSLTTGGVAYAQDNGDRNDRGSSDQAPRAGQQDRDSQGRQPANTGNVKQPEERGASQHDRDAQGRQPVRTSNVKRPEERGAGPEHAFHRGERLPAEYRHKQYVVNDWRGHHLSAPPHGYHWVQTGADYVLVAVATGIIAQLLLSN